MQSVETHQHAKFHQNWSIVCEYIKIIRFFTMVAAAIVVVEFAKFYWLTVSGGPRRITVPNFVKNRLSIAEILRFFEFPRWPPPPSWIFEITKLYWLSGSRGSRRINMPNFVKICQSVVKILRFFFDFSRWRPSSILDLFGAYLDHPQ